MLTPQEVQDKKFKQAMWGGYEMTAVDGFLEALTHDYSALFTENATLKKRLNSLTKKLEEYRRVDDDMRIALIEAQKVAEKRVSEANEMAERIVREARSETEQRYDRAVAEIALEEKRLEAARNETVSFVNNLIKLYTEQMEKLSFIPSAPPPPAPPREKRRLAADEAARDIDRSVSETMAREAVLPLRETAAEPQPVPAPSFAPPPEAPKASAGDDGGMPTTVYTLDFHDLDGFERENDTEVPIRRNLNEEVFEQNFGHKLRESR